MEQLGKVTIIGLYSRGTIEERGGVEILFSTATGETAHQPHLWYRGNIEQQELFNILHSAGVLEVENV